MSVSSGLEQHLWGVEDVHQANLNRLSANKNLRMEKKMAEHVAMMANNN
jgi:hypothetical protein